ncbi:MAG: class I adenylate-forming enzyme family protein [Acidimicrobiales bacterium]
MPRLVALDLPGGPAFLDALRRVLDAGDAALPLDQRLPAAGRERLVAALGPSAVLDECGEHTLTTGWPVEEDDALVIATSGTTGDPKGVVLTRDAVAASALATSARLGVDRASDRWCCCLPLAHVGGLSVLTRSIVTGTPVEVLPGFDRDEVLAAAARGATLVSLVPTTLGRLGDGAAAFRTIVLGGSAPPDGLGPNVVTTYGMTETGSGVVYDGLPLDGVEIRIGACDEIELRGPMLLRAYRDGTDPRRDGWLPTGDAGGLGDDGRLVVHGRLGDLVVSGGENVWPEQVEAVLRRHDNVAEVGVGGVADPEWGERVAAYVVPTRPGSAPSLEELRELALDALGPWAAPRELVVVAALPRTAIGKLRRQDLESLPALHRVVR